MIIGSENPVANYSVQSNATETLRVSLSPEMVKELDLPQDQVVKGAVSEDGKSVTLNTENGRVEIKGNFAQSAGEVVDVKVSSPEVGQQEESDNSPNVKSGSLISDTELDQIFENISEKIDQNPQLEKLKQEFQNEIDWNGDQSSGDIDILQGSPVHVEFSKLELKDSLASVWDEAPEARDTEGENSVDFTDGEINSGEDEWQGFNQRGINTPEGYAINISHELSAGGNVSLTGRVNADNHARLSMWFDSPGTAAYARQNINSISEKIQQAFGLTIDHLGISPFSRDKIDNPPKSTFMIEV